MPYIPKNKIKTGLYTDGNLLFPRFKDKDSNIYIGFYYELYNGKYYSGKDQNDPSTKEIFPADKNLNQVVNNSKIPYSPLFPTEQDYKNGIFVRCFSIRRNQPIFTEIEKTTYKQIENREEGSPWQLYRVFSLTWELTGDINKVAQTNKNIVQIIEQREKAQGLGLYLKENWTQYYKSNP